MANGKLTLIGLDCWFWMDSLFTHERNKKRNEEKRAYTCLLLLAFDFFFTAFTHSRFICSIVSKKSEKYSFLIKLRIEKRPIFKASFSFFSFSIRFASCFLFIANKLLLFSSILASSYISFELRILKTYVGESFGSGSC